MISVRILDWDRNNERIRNIHYHSKKSIHLNSQTLREYCLSLFLLIPFLDVLRALEIRLDIILG